MKLRDEGELKAFTYHKTYLFGPGWFNGPRKDASFSLLL